MPAATPQSSRTPDLAGATDRTLVDRIAEGDAIAFEELYRRHCDRAFTLARKLCPGRELAEEVTQEAFISVWRSADRYRPALGSVAVWLSSIVRNRAIDAWRRTAVRPVEVPVVTEGPGQLHAAVATDVSAPERAAVLSLIAELPPTQKEAVFLAYFGGMTHDEIATWSQAPLGTVKGRIRMGLQKIREALEGEWADGRAVPRVATLDDARRRRVARVPRCARNAPAA